MPLTIYKSSAGSGKTFTLVKEYLKLVLKRPRDFQHILAITFTNKATDEMKSRVLKYLLELSVAEPGPMLEVLSAELAEEMDRPTLQKRAEETYELIIHNYSRFEISTIDSFFSRVVRSFSRELDIPMSYELEMNTSLALEEAVNQLFRSLSDNEALRIWLEQYTFDQIEEGKSWNVEGNIQDLGRNLFKEQFQEGFDQVKIDLERLTVLVDQMKAVIDQYKRNMKSLARQALKAIEGAGLTIDDFTRKRTGPVNTFYKIIDKDDFGLNATFLATAAGEKSWYTKTSDKAALIDQLVAGAFGEAVQGLIDCVNKHERNYRTTLALFRNIYAFGLLEALNKNLKDYRDEQNIMLISDNNALIRKIVREDDAPFLYEKIGSYFKHILIDEFQDTSNFQWHNLRPLVLNSLASGHEVLIVGDVKQSIYRFRGGNMKLLLEQVDQDLATFRQVITTRNLEANYRSLKEIVTFNNAFFAELTGMLGQIEFVDDLSFIEKAYEGHQQNPQKGEGGYVQLQLFQPDESIDQTWQERALDSLVENIHRCQEQDYSYGDILVLVNKNNEMPAIAGRLLAEDIPFVSERSLMLGNHPMIRFLVESLYFLQSEEDQIGLVNLAHLYRQLKGMEQPEHLLKPISRVEHLTGLGLPTAFLERRHALSQLPLFDMVEQLLLIFDFREASDVFLQKFQDLLLEQNQRGVHSIHSFLEWWVEQGAETTISGNENANAVQIMSVHKSKGLEAPVVMVPFADYSFLPNPQLHSFWTSELPEYLSDLAFVLLHYSKNRLGNTDFEEAFREETLESVLDVLNKTYVAFTRAREKLFISGPQHMGRSSGFQKINQFMEAIFEQLPIEVNKSEKNYILKYDYNSIYKKQSLEEDREGVSPLDTYPNASYARHLSIRSDSDKFFMLQESPVSKNITLAGQVYEVLSRMASAFDAQAVVKQLVAEGRVDDRDAAEVTSRVEKLMHSPQMQAWFIGDYEVVTERELVYGGRVLRPDRVMVKGDEAVVLNYHKESAAPVHESLLRREMEAIKALGHPKTQGYLVYVDPVEIREVAL